MQHDSELLAALLMLFALGVLCGMLLSIALALW
jgi:hypothetical protein